MSIIEHVKIGYYRLEVAYTLEQALRQLLSPKAVRMASQRVAAEHLVEELARELRLDRDDLLKSVAIRLGLRVATELETPSPELIQKTGYTIELLRQKFAIPQPAPASIPGYSLVIADPQTIAVGDYLAEGIPVLLARGKIINETWKRFEWGEKSAESLTLAQLHSVLRQLAYDAACLGASEVFVGHPAEGRYEFIANEKRYAGGLHPETFSMLAKSVSPESPLTYQFDSEGIKLLKLSLTRNFQGPVFCMTWESDKIVERPVVVPKSEKKSERVYPTSRPTAISTSTERAPIELTRSVLIVDDDARFTSILTQILTGKGWKVRYALDGRTALKELEGSENLPQLVVCDVHMPEMDGPSFLKRLRTAGYAVPVLMLTSDDDQLLEAELAWLGADAYIRKQEDPRVLLAWCNNLVSKKIEYLPSAVVDVSKAGHA